MCRSATAQCWHLGLVPTHRNVCPTLWRCTSEDLLFRKDTREHLGLHVEHADSEPAGDRVVVEADGVRVLLVPVPSGAEMPAVAERLATGEGSILLQLCGGMSVETVGRSRLVGAGRAAVGHVTFAGDFLLSAAAYVRSFEEQSRHDS